MGKDDGGGVDTSGLERATREATELQKLIYEQGREDVQPWYNLGVGAVGSLADRLGISGGSILDRDQIYNELLPQYTQTQTTQSPQSGLYVGSDGRVIDFSKGAGGNFGAADRPGAFSDASDLYKQAQNQYSRGNIDAVSQMGFTPLNPTSSQDVIDYEALNAAVDERLSGQTTPDNYGSLLERFDLTKFEQDPGYEFRKQEAQRALERSMAAQGVTLGGAGYGEINPQVARAMEEQLQGLASQEYNNAYNRYVQDQLNEYNMLTGAAGMGQGSTGIMATAGQNYANNVGNLNTGLASAQLNAQLAQQSQPSMFSQLLGAGAQIAGATYGGGGWTFSDKRLKENIERVGEQNGYPLYKFNYINVPEKTYIGVMAQDVEKIKPEAVSESEGMKRVNYDMIGIEMQEVI